MNYDVLIIGSGVVGSSLAHSISDNGYKVAVLDAKSDRKSLLLGNGKWVGFWDRKNGQRSGPNKMIQVPIFLDYYIILLL